jgi:hypothetical protein
VAAFAAVAVTVIMIWSSLKNFTTAIPFGPGDPYLQAWQVQWAGHAFLTQPGNLFDTNAGWPARNTLAFTEPLLGFAPVGMLGSGVAAAIIHYNFLFILAFAGTMFGGYVLVRQIGGSVMSGYLAGAIIAFAPWRFNEVTHLNILFTGAIPVAFAFLARGHGVRLDGRSSIKRPWWALAGWLIASWEIVTSLAIGLAFAYVLCVGIIVFYIRAVSSFHGARERVSRKLLILTSVGFLIFLTSGALITRPYLRVRAEYPESRRTLAETAHYEALITSYLSPSRENFLWGGSLGHVAAAHQWFGHSAGSATFLGFSAMLCALAGVFYSRWSTRWRITIAGVMALFLTLSLGPGSPLGAIYRLLYAVLPGWSGSRTPARDVMWVTLAVAVLAAGALDKAITVMRERRARDVRRAASARWPRPLWVNLAAIALVGCVLLEGYAQLSTARQVPETPTLEGLPQPLLILPSRNDLDDSVALLWSTEGFPSIVNWSGGFVPRYTHALCQAAQRAPFAASTVRMLRADGVRTLVIDLAASRAWAIPSGAELSALGVHKAILGPDSTAFVIQR